MVCAPKSVFGKFGSLFFAGVAIGSLILPRLSDIHGRKKIAVIGNMLHLVAGSLILISKSMQFTLLLIFVMGMGMGGRVFVGYIFMTENMRVKDAS